MASYVTIPSLSPKYPRQYVPTTEAISLTREKFDQAQEYAEGALDQANAYLKILGALFASADMPEKDIDYSFQDMSLETEIASKRPDAPDIEPGTFNVPSLGTIEGITLPSIEIPSSDFGELEANFVYDEAPYTSELIDNVKSALNNYIQNGGTGLGADVEAAIWARARARQELVNERSYNETLDYFAAKGFNIPPGALAGRLAEILREQTRADAQLNYEIMIEQARLALSTSHHALTVSVQLEGIEKEFANQIANRSFEKAKAACDIIITTYNAKVTTYVAKVEACKAKAAVAESVANVQVAAGNQVISIYQAEIERYKADLAQDLGMIESVAKIYGYKISGYEADAKVAIGLLDAQIKEYEGRLTQANNQATLTIKEAELTLNSYLGALALQQEAAKGGANITAQIAASALNSVNASANLAYHVGRNQGENVTHHTGISNAGNLGENHSYQHKAS